MAQLDDPERDDRGSDNCDKRFQGTIAYGLHRVSFRYVVIVNTLKRNKARKSYELWRLQEKLKKNSEGKRTPQISCVSYRQYVGSISAYRRRRLLVARTLLTGRRKEANFLPDPLIPIKEKKHVSSTSNIMCHPKRKLFSFCFHFPHPLRRDADARGISGAAMRH